MFPCIMRQKTTKNGKFNPIYHEMTVAAYTISERRYGRNRKLRCVSEGYSMVQWHGCHKGLVFTAFGAGILLALCFPVKIMLFILAVMLVILGLIACQR